MLSPAVIANACGQDEYEDVEQLEIIFSEANEIGSIDGMYRLQSLTMIMNNLQRISGLSSVASTLQRLCLCEQEIVVMENLALPHLQELLLQKNKISAISGLQGCPRLRKLWLFSNRISRIEELHYCGFLTELWLQDNQIDVIEGLDSLVSLRQLELAGNRIASVDQLQKLSSLTNLHELSFKDIHFGDCPVTLAAGYREAVACYLRQVARLDGVEITQDEEMAARTVRNEQIAMFNQAANELQLEFHRQVLELNNKRTASATHTATFQKEVETAMQDLESLIADGRDSMQRELKRYNDIFKINMRHLSNRVNHLTKEAETQLKLLADQEQSKLAHAELAFTVLEAITIAEGRMTEAVETIKQSPQPAYSCRPLDDQTPDYHMLLQDLRLRQSITHHQQLGPVDVVRAYRLVQSQPLATPRGSSSDRLPHAKLFFFIAPIENFQATLIRGLHGREDQLIMYDSLEMAVAMDVAQYGTAASISSADDLDLSCDKEEPETQPHDNPVHVYIAVACTVSGVAQEDRMTVDVDTLHNNPLRLRRLLSTAPVPAAVHLDLDLSSSPRSTHTQQSPRSKGRTCVSIPADALRDGIVSLEHCMLCVPAIPGVDVTKIDDLIDGLSQPEVPAFEEVQLFETFQAALQVEVRKYREQILEQVDPTTADQLREADSAIARREDSVYKLRSQIDSERQAQEAMIREARSTMSARQAHSQPGVQTRTQQAYSNARSKSKQRYPKPAQPPPQHRQRPVSAGRR